MTLKIYNAKRDFRRTTEPSGNTASGRVRKADRPLFVIQKHAASHLHYDFRLELDGALKSWAVPKGPSIDPATKSLAVQVEDHPLAYASFEGTIPAGQYGAGAVIVWDQGAWELLDTPSAVEALTKGRLKFVLHGSKLKGVWNLVRMRSRQTTDKPQWLLFKHEDKYASGDPAKDPRVTKPWSVLSKRTLEDLAGTPDAPRATTGAVSPSRRGKRGGNTRRSTSSTSAFAAPRGAVVSAFPDTVDVQLATLREIAPNGDDWIHEQKYDGYRIVAHVHNGSCVLRTRTGLDWTERFPEIAAELAALDRDSFVIDGEIVKLDDKGVARFQDLQSALSAHRSAPLVYYVFDLLYAHGLDLRACSLKDRHGVLTTLFKNHPARGRVRISEHISGDGAQMLRRACSFGLEGIVSKLSTSTYRGVRSTDWIKTKCGHRQEFVVGGYTEPNGSRVALGSLLLGVYSRGRCTYAGRVGSGFAGTDLSSLYTRLELLASDTCPFHPVPPKADTGRAHWVRPEVVVEVAFAEWTSDGRLRHPVFLGVREDKSALDVVRERSRAPKPTRRTSRPTENKRSAMPASPSRRKPLKVEITHPDRLMIGDSTLTKQGLAEYYARVASDLLEHAANRPLALLRCPEGAAGKCFFHKHMPIYSLPGLGLTPIKESKGTENYIYLRTIDGPVSLAQMNVIEIHTWGSRVDDIEKPDRLVIDLDPAPDVTWSSVVEGALLVRELLEKLELESFVKTTGGKGLHVCVPIHRTVEWDTAKAFTRAIAGAMTAMQPDRYVNTATKSKRGGKVFVDYLRNGRGATFVTPLSVRARAGAPVSVPVAWDALPNVNPMDFTVHTLSDNHLRNARKAWRPMAASRQRLSASVLKAVGQ